MSIRPALRLTSTEVGGRLTRAAAGAAAMAALLGGCRPDTTRPAFLPLPEAAATEIRLPPAEATRRLAEALAAESLPPSRIRIRDAYLETAWLDSATGQPTGRRPLGTDVVRLHAWADPARPGSSLLIVETTYRPLADPSRPDRELDRQVPREHPVAVKVERILEALVKRFGGPPRPAAQPAATPRAATPRGATPRDATPRGVTPRAAPPAPEPAPEPEPIEDAGDYGADEDEGGGDDEE